MERRSRSKRLFTIREYATTRLWALGALCYWGYSILCSKLLSLSLILCHDRNSWGFPPSFIKAPLDVVFQFPIPTLLSTYHQIFIQPTKQKLSPRELYIMVWQSPVIIRAIGTKINQFRFPQENLSSVLTDAENWLLRNRMAHALPDHMTAWARRAVPRRLISHLHLLSPKQMVRPK